ncbi:MAG: universal stress protein [Reyranella sp.]|nr:universal stress protein [Reyranella sp.]
MKKLLVATDFSTRSDRAIRRAILLAKRHGAGIILVHAIDDDQPQRIAEAELNAATDLLIEQARTLREIDGVPCDWRVVPGEPFEAIARAGDEVAADLVVLGAHRRLALRGIFVGTTAERTIRTGRLPILMANAVPAGPYRRMLIAVDLSAGSGDAVRAVGTLGLDMGLEVGVVHVFEAPGNSLVVRAAMTQTQSEAYLTDQEAQAASELSAFLRGLNVQPARWVLKPYSSSAADAICAAAREASADLVVVGTRGRTGFEKFLLGSVAEEVLRVSDCDVLAVPPSSALSGLSPRK